MKSGSAQNDSVSGEAKLSCTRATVRSVGRLIGGRRLRHLLGPDDARVLQLPGAGAERRLAASMRLSSRSRPSRRNTLTCDAVSRLPCSSTPCAWMIATPCGAKAVVGLPQPQLAAGQRQRAAAGPEVGVVQRLGAARTSPTTAGSPPSVANTPSSSAHSVGQRRGTPRPKRRAARATISSEERVSRQKHRCRRAARRTAGSAWRYRAGAAPAISRHQRERRLRLAWPSGAAAR